MRVAFAACLLICIFAVTLAQPANSSCIALVQTALAQTDTACADLGRNRVCYGNRDVDVAFHTDTTDVPFDVPGDQIDLLDVASLRLGAMTVPDEWGISVMSLQANLPDSLPGQNVTMILIGEVEIRDDTESTTVPEVSVSSQTVVDVLNEPGTNGFSVDTLSANTPYMSSARDASGEFLLVHTDGVRTGWVRRSEVQIKGDAVALPEYDPTLAIRLLSYTPMQAITLRTGIGRPQCAAAPADGVIIQSPKGAGTVMLEVNHVRVSLGSTAFVQAVWGERMSISTLEGLVDVSVGNLFVSATKGARIDIPLNEDGFPVDDPAVWSYDESAMAPLIPVVNALAPDPIVLAPAAQTSTQPTATGRPTPTATVMVTDAPEATRAPTAGMFSPTNGEACVPTGVTWTLDASASASAIGPTYVGGFWTVSAGTTAQLSVPDDANLNDPDGYPYGTSDYIWIVLVDGSNYGQLVARSGTERSITFTFEQGGQYAVMVSGRASAPAVAEISILCNPPER